MAGALKPQEKKPDSIRPPSGCGDGAICRRSMDSIPPLGNEEGNGGLAVAKNTLAGKGQESLDQLQLKVDALIARTASAVRSNSYDAGLSAEVNSLQQNESIRLTAMEVQKDGRTMKACQALVECQAALAGLPGPAGPW